MTSIIHVEDVGKQYRVGRREAPYATLRESLTRGALAPFNRLRRVFSRCLGKRGPARDVAGPESFWALQDVSFEVQPGEILGVIGRNGAGKSTLLKILSRITEPTTGRVDLYGRVGSLLEVGTGFHPELTGRENVYLNGVILGMGRREIARKFDEIVEFAEVEMFIDTPVKRYSSGMQMRLAFAVAAHLDPEILIIDEVLAVGDAQFQKKCLDKMHRLSRGDRTILFVSHNMSALRHICHRGLALERGRLVDQGEINAVVDRYLMQGGRVWSSSEPLQTLGFEIQAVEIASERGSVIKTFDPVRINVRFTPKVDVVDPGLYVGFLSNDNERLAGLDTKDFRSMPLIRAGQPAELGFLVESLPLMPGAYRLEIYLKDAGSHRIELVSESVPFEVVESPVYGGRKLDHWFGRVGLKAKVIDSVSCQDVSIKLLCRSS